MLVSRGQTAYFSFDNARDGSKSFMITDAYKQDETMETVTEAEETPSAALVDSPEFAAT